MMKHLMRWQKHLWLIVVLVQLDLSMVWAQQSFPIQGYLNTISETAHFRVDFDYSQTSEAVTITEMVPESVLVSSDKALPVHSLQLLPKSSQGHMSLDVNREAENAYTAKISIEHLQTPLVDISSEIRAHIQVPQSPQTEDATVKGAFASPYTILDYKPVNEFDGQFSLKDHILTFDNIRFDAMSCKGSIDLNDGFHMDFEFRIKDMPLSRFIAFWLPRKNLSVDGQVSGLIRLKGTWDSMFLSGELIARSGYIKNILFNKIVLNMDGTYPHMRIYDSSLITQDGLDYNLKGQFNLSEKKRFKSQIKALKFSPRVRSVQDEREWSIRQIDVEDFGYIELKYQIRPQQDGAQTHDSGLLGIERTVEF